MLQNIRVHGLWVWQTASVLEASGSAGKLLDFCQSKGIDEVYVSFSEQRTTSEDSQLTDLIGLLHGSSIRVEALLSSTDADESGEPQDQLLDMVQEILEFNQQHPTEQFDGIHLDIEPQQRPENQGAHNLSFLPGLVATYQAVLAVAEPAQMTANADIARKFLRGDYGERSMLLSALPRLTLMLYGLSSPSDGESAAEMAKKVRKVSEEFLEEAYADLDQTSLAQMGIALREADYGELLPDMLKTLDDANGANPNYLGWVRESYNDYLNALESSLS